MIPADPVVLPNLERFLLFSALTVVPSACDPNVVIGAKWNLTEGAAGGQVGAAGSVSGGGVGSGGSAAEPVAGTSGDDEGGTSGIGPDTGSAGAGGAPSMDEWCATAPWVNAPEKFIGDPGSVIPAGSYLLVYVSGAQIHDVDIGYEVTRHYTGKNGIEAGHHLFSGESPETGATSVWLDEVGIVGAGGTIAEVERANRGHTWPFEHAGGELEITLYDDDYHDNSGPGSRFCIVPAAR